MYENLVSEAFEAMKSAYAPYSNYHGRRLRVMQGRPHLSRREH